MTWQRFSYKADPRFVPFLNCLPANYKKVNEFGEPFQGWVTLRKNKNIPQDNL